MNESRAMWLLNLSHIDMWWSSLFDHPGIESFPHWSNLLEEHLSRIVVKKVKEELLLTGEESSTILRVLNSAKPQTGTGAKIEDLTFSECFSRNNFFDDTKVNRPTSGFEGLLPTPKVLESKETNPERNTLSNSRNLESHGPGAQTSGGLMVQGNYLVATTVNSVHQFKEAGASLRHVLDLVKGANNPNDLSVLAAIDNIKIINSLISSLIAELEEAAIDIEKAKRTNGVLEQLRKDLPWINIAVERVYQAGNHLLSEVDKLQ